MNELNLFGWSLAEELWLILLTRSGRWGSTKQSHALWMLILLNSVSSLLVCFCFEPAVNRKRVSCDKRAIYSIGVSINIGRLQRFLKQIRQNTVRGGDFDKETKLTQAKAPNFKCPLSKLRSRSKSNPRVQHPEQRIPHGGGQKSQNQIKSKMSESGE